MSIYDSHKPPAGEGSGLYLKIQDGESVKVRIASEPAIFESVYERGEEKNISTRYGWLVWNQETNQPQILQQGVRFFRQVAALAQDEEWGEPQEYDIKITRHGSDTDTTYNVTPSANREPLDINAKNALNKINLIEKLEAGQGVQRVMWLSEFDDQSNNLPTTTHTDDIEGLRTVGEAKRSMEPEPRNGIEKARATADRLKAKTEDVVVTDIGDGFVNLDDIPF